MTAAPPDNPAGPFSPTEAYEEAVKTELIETIRQAPSRLREAVSGLTDSQLDTLYKNWTARQIVHHIADSHVHMNYYPWHGRHHTGQILWLRDRHGWQ